MNIKQERERPTELKGKEWIRKYNNLYDEMKERMKVLDKQLSEYDLQEQDILHYIEMKKCDAIMGARLMKKLKEITADRRIVKDERVSLDSITSNKHRCNYKPNETYTFKTNVINDLIGENKHEIK